MDSRVSFSTGLNSSKATNLPKTPYLSQCNTFLPLQRITEENSSNKRHSQSHLRLEETTGSSAHGDEFLNEIVEEYYNPSSNSSGASFVGTIPIIIQPDMDSRKERQRESICWYIPKFWDNQEWEIEDIVDERFTPQGKEYMVVWKNSWVTASGLRNAERLVNAFYMRNDRLDQLPNLESRESKV